MSDYGLSVAAKEKKAIGERVKVASQTCSLKISAFINGGTGNCVHIYTYLRSNNSSGLRGKFLYSLNSTR